MSSTFTTGKHLIGLQASNLCFSLVPSASGHELFWLFCFRSELWVQYLTEKLGIGISLPQREPKSPRHTEKTGEAVQVSPLLTTTYLGFLACFMFVSTRKAVFLLNLKIRDKLYLILSNNLNFWDSQSNFMQFKCLFWPHDRIDSSAKSKPKPVNTLFRLLC